LQAIITEIVNASSFVKTLKHFSRWEMTKSVLYSMPLSVHANHGQLMLGLHFIANPCSSNTHALTLTDNDFFSSKFNNQWLCPVPTRLECTVCHHGTSYTF